MTGHSIGIVIPTLGDRLDYLAECVNSVRSAGPCTLAIVASAAARNQLTDAGIEPDLWVNDPGCGAAGAINAGVAELPSDVSMIGWIGDDDLLEARTLLLLAESFRNGVVAVFGQCRYVDQAGSELFVNRSGRFAPVLMRVGPNLLPQPGSLILRSSWEAVGGLDASLRWTFDLDLFIRLRRHGRLRYVNSVVASFRWHPGSLTAGARQGSVDEASRVRLQHLPSMVRPFARLWEPLMRRVILAAGHRVTRRVAERDSAVGA